MGTLHSINSEGMQGSKGRGRTKKLARYSPPHSHCIVSGVSELDETSDPRRAASPPLSLHCVNSPLGTKLKDCEKSKNALLSAMVMN